MKAMPAILIVAAALGGCVAEDGFPSLAPRPAERDLSTEEPERLPAEPADDVALRAQVSELRAQAAEGDRAFDAAFPGAQAAVSAAGRRESDSWVAAQQALSRLEAARTPTMRALAELDGIAVERAGQPASTADLAAIDAAIEAVGQIAAAQQERIDRLRARVSG